MACRGTSLFAALVVCAAHALAEEAPPSPEEAQERVREPAPVTIVVTGTRTPRRATEDPIGTEVVGARELQQRNVRDASRALDAEPGIQVERSFRGSSVQVRGLESKYLRVLVDGMPVVGQVNDVIDLRRYSMDGIERIEVVRGAASALYGSDALAGVMNLISRRPRKAVEGSGFVQYGQLNSSAAGLYAGTKRGSLGATLALNWFGNDSYDLTPGNEDLSTNGDARRAATGTARLFWKPRESLDVMGFLRAGYFDTRGVDLQPPRALWNRRVGEVELAAGATIGWHPSERTRVMALLQGNRFGRSFWREQRQGPGLDDQRSQELLFRGEAQVDTRVRDAFTIAGGAGGQRAQLDSPRITGGAATTLTGWGYLQAELSKPGLGELVLGGRLDLDRDFGTHLTPRIAARLSLSPMLTGLSVRASYGQGFRAPSLGERYLDFKNGAANYVVRGNAGLRPEVSNALQAGLEWSPPASSMGRLLPTVRLTVHTNALEGLIQPVDPSGTQTYFQYQNYSTATLRGLELMARLSVDRWLTVDAGGALLDAQGTLDGVTRRLPGRARYQLTGMVIAVPAEWGTELTLRGQWQGGRSPLDPEAQGDAPNLLLVDARVAQRLHRFSTGTELQLYLSAENLLNATDITFLTLPGRLVLGGLQARL